MPVATVKVNEGRAPLLLVALIWDNGFVHETGTELPNTVSVGCPGSLLHSMAAPVELAVKPEPETVTLAPLVKPVDGVTRSVPEAPASAATKANPAPDAKSAITTAAMTRGRIRRIRVRMFPLCPLVPHSKARLLQRSASRVETRRQHKAVARSRQARLHKEKVNDGLLATASKESTPANSNSSRRGPRAMLNVEIEKRLCLHKNRTDR